nr:phospholipase D family protein [Bacteroidota bacterium]
DGKIVITGGRNIADEYFDYDHEYNFRDRDVLLLGKIASDVHNSFEQFWNSPLSVDICELANTESPQNPDSVTYNALHNYACNPENFWPQVREKIKNLPAAFDAIQKSGGLVWLDSVYFISDIPGKNDGTQGLEGGGVCTEALIQLIKNAKHTIAIQSPYLITNDASRKLLLDAVKRGVKIKILTNSLASTDNLEAFSGYQRDRKKLLATGVRIFEFRPDAAERYKVMTGDLQSKLNYTPVFGLHAKSMVIDGSITVIGTFNFDPRSANLNTECVAVIHSNKISTSVLNGMEIEFNPENSWETTKQWNPDSDVGNIKRLKTWTKKIVPKNIL